MRFEGFVLSLPLVLAGCDVPKLGKRGATCTASSDCEGALQCVHATCLDEAALAEQQTARERDAQREAELAALAAELKVLQAEQQRLQAQRQEIEANLAAVKGEADRAAQPEPSAPAEERAPRKRDTKGESLGLKNPFTKR